MPFSLLLDFFNFNFPFLPKADLGVDDNKYTVYTMDDVHKVHVDLGGAINKYKEEYDAEVKRQEEMEAKRKEFAQAAENFVSYVDSQKKTIQSLTGEPEPLTAEIKNAYMESEPQKKKLQDLQRINKEAVAMGILFLFFYFFYFLLYLLKYIYCIFFFEYIYIYFNQKASDTTNTPHTPSLHSMVTLLTLISTYLTIWPLLRKNASLNMIMKSVPHVSQSG